MASESLTSRNEHERAAATVNRGWPFVGEGRDAVSVGHRVPRQFTHTVV